MTSEREQLDSTINHLAHDVLNAIAAISGRAQMMRRRIERVDHLNRDHLAADLRTIEAQAAEASTLVAACRRLAEKSSGSGEVEDSLRPPNRPLDQ